MKRRSLRWIQLIGAVLFVYILLRLDFRKVLEQLQSIQLQWMVVYVAAFGLTAYLKSRRWRIVLLKQSISISQREALRITVLTGMWGVLTPGRAGELAKVAYLDYPEISLTRRFVSVILDRLYDIVFLLLFGLAGSMYFLRLFSGLPSGDILAGALIIIAAVFGIVFRQGAARTLKRMFRMAVSPQTYRSISNEWNVFWGELSCVFVPTMAAMGGISFFVYLCYFVQVFAVAKGYGVDVPFIYLALCTSLSALVSLLPITVGGVGTREAVFVVLLGKIAVPSETAVLISFTDGVVLALLMSVAMAVAVSLFSRLHLGWKVPSTRKD